MGLVASDNVCANVIEADFKFYLASLSPLIRRRGSFDDEGEEEAWVGAREEFLLGR